VGLAGTYKLACWLYSNGRSWAVYYWCPTVMCMWAREQADLCVHPAHTCYCPSEAYNWGLQQDTGLLIIFSTGLNVAYSS